MPPNMPKNFCQPCREYVKAITNLDTERKHGSKRVSADIWKAMRNYLITRAETRLKPRVPQTSFCLRTGNSRIRLPVAAKMALEIAGAITGTPGSPTPAGGASELTIWMCVSYGANGTATTG